MVKTKTVGPHVPRNKPLANGIMKFSHARMYQKTAGYKKKKIIPKEKKPEEKPTTRRPRSFPVEQRKRKKSLRPKKTFSKHVRRIRPSITPGTVLIILTGRHKGKRVIFLKSLSSGLLLVTGPMKFNGCPLRRLNQRFVMATKTKLDVSNVKLPEQLNDEFFRRQKGDKKSKDATEQLFQKTRDVYSVSNERKDAQKDVDKQLFTVIQKRDDKKLFVFYLRTLFSLGKKDYPHKMLF